MCEDNSQDKMLVFVMLSLGTFDKHIKIDPSQSVIIRSCSENLSETSSPEIYVILWILDQTLITSSVTRLSIYPHYLFISLHQKAKKIWLSDDKLMMVQNCFHGIPCRTLPEYCTS
jgi:hypothetical protein